jgi:acetolactate synthase small subunit
MILDESCLQHTPSRQTCAYAMTLADDVSAVERVAGLLRRRGHRVLRLSFGPSGETGTCRMDVEVLPKRGRDDRIAPELAKLESVLKVELVSLAR